MDIKKPLLVKVEAFIYAFVYSCVRSSATPSFYISLIRRSAAWEMARRDSRSAHSKCMAARL